MIHSEYLLSALENNGIDHATAETIVSLADEKPIPEARELLSGMLGDGDKHMLSYISSRQNIEVKQRNQRLPSAIKVESAKPRAKPKQPEKQVSTNEKIDSVKDLEAALQNLNTNSSTRKQCDCMGSVHGLLEVAPNCLNCGRIICNKEGLGPCLFCKELLLPNEELQKITDILTKQKNSIVATMSKKALVAAGIDPDEKLAIDLMFKSRTEAEKNLERLLEYQAEDSVRTRIVDRVGDIDLPGAGGTKWVSPSEQAETLRAQQTALRRKAVAKRIRTQGSRKVLSIDVRGNKVYQTIEDAPVDDEYLDLQDAEDNESQNNPTEEPLNDDGSEDTQATHYFDPKAFGQYKKPSTVKNVNDKNAPEVSDVEKLHILRDADESLLL